jgi:hypothetical protein
LVYNKLRLLCKFSWSTNSRIKCGTTYTLALGAIGKWGANMFFIILILCQFSYEKVNNSAMAAEKG